MMKLAVPFVLLDDSRPSFSGGGWWSLTTQPDHLLIARSPADIPKVLAALDDHVAAGASVSGFIAYETLGYFEPRLKSALLRDTDIPFLWLTVSYGGEKIGRTDVADLLTGNPPVGPLTLKEPDQLGAWYDRAFAAIQQLIQAGDCYQINLTYPLDCVYRGDPISLYGQMRQAQPAPFSALIHTGDHIILSASPEQFVKRQGNRLQAAPMKGTAKRSPQTGPDEGLKYALRQDEKNRAENLMIVDLLRNDLARISKAGTVTVPDLFRVDSYPTLHQMVSTIEAEAEADLTPSTLLAALFPCGSVTGAPKVRAMEIIQDIEKTPRGVYCGSIVRFKGMGSTADWSLSVPIRTLTLQQDANSSSLFTGSLGVGSGLVADSDCPTELAECRLKAAFAQPQDPSPMVAAAGHPNLIESMRLDHDGARWTLPLLDQHLDRLSRSAAYFGYRQQDWGSAIKNWLTRQDLAAASYKLRVEVQPDGTPHAFRLDRLAPKADPVLLGVSRIKVRSDDPWLHHKTTNRTLYTRALTVATQDGLDDLIFLNEKGHATETAIYSLFLQDKDDIMKTPPQSDGLLPGVLRQTLLEGGKADEQSLTLKDLKAAKQLYVGNSVRGLLPARLVLGHP